MENKFYNMLLEMGISIFDQYGNFRPIKEIIMEINKLTIFLKEDKKNND